MRFLSLLHEKAGFTENEVKVVLFLGATFLVGLAYQWYHSSRGGAASGSPYDYTLLDSEFTARSQLLDSLPPERATQAAFVPREPGKLSAGASINVNSATEEELTRLPGIGPEYAARIVRHRGEHGAFETVDALLRVKGIGPKKLEKIRPFVRVR